jgi:hypothetical protein
MNDWKGEMVIVDGKQRLTALLKFLDNDLKVFGGYTLNQIDNLFLNAFDIEIAVNTLQTRKEVLTWYLELNAGGTDHTQTEIQHVKDLLDKE